MTTHIGISLSKLPIDINMAKLIHYSNHNKHIIMMVAAISGSFTHLL